MGIPEEEAHIRTRGFYKFNRRATRELAAVWDPDIPLEKNQAFLNKIRDLNKSIDCSIGIPKEDLPHGEGLSERAEIDSNITSDTDMKEVEAPEIEVIPVKGEVIDQDEFTKNSHKS